MSAVTSQPDAFAQSVPAFSAMDEAAAQPRSDISFIGMLLISAMAVVMAVLCAVMLAGIVLCTWWLVSHIPVPPVVTKLLGLLHLA